MKITAIDHLVLTVANIPRAVAFYSDILGMAAQSFTAADGSVRTALVFGKQKINLHSANAPFAPHAGNPMTGTADLCLLTDDDLGEWINHFRMLNIDILEGPIARTGARGPINSIYLRDPDQNLIEISTYD
ncbi:VOC family protein [Amylibacter sp.]|nr:VOC family protein [Amylibacter sp.]